MRKLKSYTSIWNVEKVFYAINDVKLPFAVTSTQMLWFVCAFIFVLMFADVPPFSMVRNVLVRQIGIPAAVAWFMSTKMLDGKRPHRYLSTQIAYAIGPRVMYAGKAVKTRKQKIKSKITAVRSEVYVPN